MAKRKLPIRNVTTFSDSSEDVNEVDLPNKEIRNSGSFCPTSISIYTNHLNGNEDISKAKQGQRIRRERERAQSMLNALIVPIVSNPLNGAVCPNGSEGISQAKQGQRIRREREKTQSMLNSAIEPVSQTKVNGRKRKSRENSQGIQPMDYTEQQQNQIVTNYQLGQRQRRERERAKAMLKKNESIMSEENNQKKSTSNKRKLSQRSRREQENIKRTAYSYTMDGLNIVMPSLDKGKEPIIEFICRRGSSSTGSSTNENEFIKPWPIKRTNSSDPRSKYPVVDIHPIFDSHYDEILVDEMTIPTERTIVSKKRHDLGRMEYVCKNCNAYHWLDEQLSASRKNNPLFGRCCLQGKIRLPLLSPLPAAIQSLYEGSDSMSKSFRQNIRSYNNANAFSSLGAKMDDRILRGRGPLSFTIHGELHHLSGSLLPEDQNNPCYSQLYIYDPNEAFEVRKKRNNYLDPQVLKIIQDTLLEENQLCQIYKNAYEILKEANHDENDDIPVRLSYIPGTDPRRYNLPTSDDVSVLLPGDGTEKTTKRDIVLHLKNNSLKQISECHPLYLPTHFVLLFPKGDLGWYTEMKHWDKVNQRFYTGDEKQNRLTQLEYFRYRLFERSTESSVLFLAGPLFQEFIVDAWASYEQNRLNYVKENQPKLRCEVYGGLSDMVTNGDDPREIGKRFILPSSHIGSPRHMYEIYQDSMALTRYFKHPDIFLTVTANPKWPEIQNELKPGQCATDRPDLVARVFELKRAAIVHEILHNNVFGRVVGRVYTIEFQKRGLPHMHALFFLHHDDKIRTAEQVDKIVSAEFPDPEKHPELFETVKKCMVHGPCGRRNMFNSCMENDVCKFHYPKQYATETKLDTDGYPIYRRRETFKTYKVRGHMVDNRDVVPYNPYLSEMFDCHINVEICASIRAVKYIHKYIYKGHDRATMVVGGVDDEIQQYIDARYIGPTEGAWRLYGNRMHEESPSVERLSLHLEGMHLCVFNPHTPKEEILERAKNQKSSLTEFFTYCKKNPDARCYTYQEFPEHFVWNKGKKEWTPRMTSEFSIGRLYFANPNCGERFYLRLLLTVVPGPVSFQSLYWYENIRYNTYKEACIARGLLENDNEWDKCLAESALIKTGYQLRKLFVLILTECNPACPGALWETHCLDICDDLPHKLKTHFLITNPSDEQVCDYGLFLVNEYLNGLGKSLTDYPNMPLPTKDWHRTANNRLIFEHEALAYEGLDKVAEEKIAKMNTEQLHAYTEVTNSVLNDSGKVFFLSGPAGTGKTFVYNTIADSLRSKCHIVIMVASSGVASLLLTGGRTAHSTFKIPLNVLDDSVCDIGKKSFKAELFKRAKLIVWDEVPMQHRYCVEAVDRTLQDILGNKKKFGGITTVLGGDFKQTLPVITKGTRPEIVSSSLIRSHLWIGIEKLFLVQNMRLNCDDVENLQFADYLIKVGTDPTETIELPKDISRCQNSLELLFKVYPKLNIPGTATDDYLRDRTILSARNDDVSLLNALAIQNFPGELHEYLAADKAIEDDERVEYRGYRIANENMHALDPPSLPPFKLQLKEGCPIMLLRNIQPRDGLCNRTRLMVIQFGTRVIEARILTGSHVNDRVFIPRITLEPSDSETPFKMSRRQFPIRLAFAMTINKSQGQSVKFVGIDLQNPVFSHGQLYVAMSRCTSMRRISVLLPKEDEEKTTNVMYPEVLI